METGLCYKLMSLLVTFLDFCKLNLQVVMILILVRIVQKLKAMQKKLKNTLSNVLKNKNLGLWEH